MSESKDDGRTTAASESTEATEEPEEEEQQPSLGERLTSFQSLVFVKAFREEKVKFSTMVTLRSVDAMATRT